MKIDRAPRFGSCLILVAFVALVYWNPAIAQVGEQPDRDVIVPNFWDPKSRVERPQQGAVRSIRFLTSADFPPFQFYDRRGVLIGFNVDLAVAICRVLKVKCAMQIRPFDTLGEALSDGTGDAIIAGLSKTRARSSGRAFTKPYFRIPARFIARRDTPFDVTAPGNGFVGVTCGSAHLAYIEEFFPALTPACYPNTAIALEQLRAGSIDLIFADALFSATWMHGEASEGCCTFASGPFIDERYFGPGMSIAVREADTTLRKALDFALRELHRTGVYEELYLRYFPVSLF